MSYTCDQLNRLVQSASNVTGIRPFAYDGFGNLTQQGQTSLSVDPNTNRINSAGYQYNANGNVTQTPDLTTYAYDVANRLVSNNAIYNPRNQRVFDGTYLYLYTPEGKLVGKYQPIYGSSLAFIQGQPNLYFAGKLIQEGNQWVMTDRLGSVRLHATNGRSSYQPYGAEVAPATSDQRTKFATYFRDSAGLDYAGQRYYGNAMGRFLTPDPGGMKAARLKKPNSWNMYAYVNGDPINHSDPTGLGIWDTIKGLFSGGDDDVPMPVTNDPDDDDGGGGGGYPCYGDEFSPSPNPACYVPGGDGDSPPTEEAWKCPANYQAWIGAHGVDAVVTGLSEANVLATSAIESGWGGGRFAQLGNSFFNLETLVPAPAPGTELTLPPNKYAYQLSWVPALEAHTSGPDKGKLSLVASYNSAADSFKSFAATDGKYLSGVTDPTKFASILVAHGINAGRASYFGNTVQTFQDCLSAQRQ